MIEALARASLAVFMAAGLLVTAESISSRMVGGSCMTRRWVAGIVVLLWLPLGLFHALAVFGLFRPLPAALAIGVVAAATLQFAGGFGAMLLRVARDAVLLRRVRARVLVSPRRGWILAFALLTAPSLFRALLVVFAGSWLLWLAIRRTGMTFSSPVARIAICGGLLALAIATLGGLRTLYRNDFYRREFVLHWVPKYWVPAAEAVDEPGLEHRIAVTSGPEKNLDNWFASPFLGRALQNEVLYVPISKDGRIRHFGSGSANRELVETANVDAWIARLRTLRVSEVMSFLPRSTELDFMESRPAEFERIQGERARWGLFRLRQPPITAR